MLVTNLKEYENLKDTFGDTAKAEKLIELLLQIKGITSVEIVNEENLENDLKKAINKSKEQLKKGDYESLINDIFETFVQK